MHRVKYRKYTNKYSSMGYKMLRYTWLTAMEYLHNKWSRICSICCKNSPVLSSFMTYHSLVCFSSIFGFWLKAKICENQVIKMSLSRKSKVLNRLVKIVSGLLSLKENLRFILYVHGTIHFTCELYDI
jgi:hypothetical protein